MTQTTGRVNFNYFKISGYDLDVSKILSLDIYESIDYPGITGSIVFEDLYNVRDILDVFGGDIVQMSFGRAADPPLTLEYHITDSPMELVIPNSDKKYLQINFCSRWIIDGFTQNRSRVYRNAYIYEIVEDLIKECGGKCGIFERTKQKLDRFVSPFWSPIQTIRYLMSYAVNENDVGGYLLFTDIDTDTVNFITYNQLISRDGNIGFVPFKLTFTPGHAYSPERIYDMSTESTYDLIKYGNIGMGRSNFIGFDYDTGEVINVDQKITDYNHNHLSTSLPLSLPFLSDRYKTVKESFVYPNTDDLIRDEVDENEYKRTASELIQGKLNTKQSLSMSDIVSININTMGEGKHKKAGRLVWIDFPSRAAQDKTISKRLAGTYLIKNLKHSVDEYFNYTNVLNVICDGFKLTERPDFIQWTNKTDTYHTKFDVGVNG